MIEVKNVDYSYSKYDHALKEISFTVKKGKWLSIIGHNGSGKSTIAKLLIGLLKPDKGEIFFDGELLNEKSVQTIRQKVGIVFQNPDNQFVGATVKHDIAFGLENRNIDRDTMHKLVLESAKSVGMEDYLDREPYKLSGGQKQKVAIAGIFALDCPYIIFDEATSMLDPTGIEEVVALIKELKKDPNKTIIMITHDVNLAALSDEIIVLKMGEVIAVGEPHQIFSQEEMLKTSSLEIPTCLKLFNEVSDDEVLGQNERLKEVLWQLYLKK